MRKLLLCILFISTVVSQTNGQVISLSKNATYLQNFNELANTAGSTTNNLTINGWYLNETGGGARDNEQYAVDAGTGSTGDTFSYGSAASLDRALGSLRSGTLISMYGAYFYNGTNEFINSITITYSGELWRTGNVNRPDKLAFSYSTNATALDNGNWIDFSNLDFTATSDVQGAKDGDANTNKTLITATITGLNIRPGNNFFIRWEDSDATGSDDGLAIDDFSLSTLTTLPISLNSFTAKPNAQNIDLAWATAAEQNNALFEVLRSGDGKTFNKIGDVKGSGTTTEAKQYAFVDKFALPGTSYYKLKQIDFDGKFETSELIAVKSNVKANNFAVSANSDNDLKATIYAANAGMGTFSVFDLNGRRVATQAINLTKGYNNVAVAFNSIGGLYIAKLTIGGEILTQKFVK